MMPDEVTIGELARRIDRIDRAMADGFREVSRTIEAQQFVHIDRYDADRRADKQHFDLIDQRHSEIKETTKRLWWLILAAVVGLIGEAVLFLALTRGGP